MSAVELTAEQGEALGALDVAIEGVGAAFDVFTTAAQACDEAGVPQPILVGKAGELQQLIMQRMLAS